MIALFADAHFAIEKSAVGIAFVADDEGLIALRACAKQGDFLFLVQFFGDAEEEVHRDAVFVQDLARLFEDKLRQGLLKRHAFADFDGVDVGDIGFAGEMRTALFFDAGGIKDNVGLCKTYNKHAFFVTRFDERSEKGFRIEDKTNAI